jgi:SAM-dependent methyltransferase
MTALTATPSKLQGVAQIFRFNWTFYVIGTTAIVAALVLVTIGDPTLPRAARVVLLIGIALAAFWLVASLVVSHVVYDRSRLRTWSWIGPALGIVPRRWINLHAGLDESTPALRELFPDSAGRVFDIFDAAEMTERSILRARAKATNAVAPEPVDYRRLPVADGACDAAMLLLSAHELRRPESRATLFRELRRVLAPGGKVVLAEHLRGAANFVAFGPGFLHFHSRAAWLAAAAAGGFVVEREFRITPFVAVFVLRRPS